MYSIEFLPAPAASFWLYESQTARPPEALRSVLFQPIDIEPTLRKQPGAVDFREDV
jgi:hypothetical protein